MQLLKLFDPAVRIIGNMKYTKKIALGSFIFFLPVLVFLIFGYNHLGSQYRAIKKFQSNFYYSQKIQKAFKYILLERGMMAAFKQGDFSYKPRIEINFNWIKTAIADVDAVLPPASPIQEEWKAIKNKWAALRQEIWSLSAQESFERHTALADQFLRLMQNTGIDSDTVANIDLGILHFGEILSEHLPTLIHDSGKARAIGIGVILKKSISLEEKKRAISIYGAIQSLTSDIRHAYETACSFYPDICPAISSSISKIIQESSSFSDIYISVINSERFALNPDMYFGQATQTLYYYFNEYDALESILQKLLDDKLVLLGKQTFAIVTVVLFMLACLIYFMTGFYLSFIESLKSLTKASEMIAQGDFDISVPVRTKDEMADVSHAFNQMNQKIKQTFAFLESYKKAIDKSNIVSITDIRGDIIYVNDPFCDITGYTRKELIGQNHRILKDPSTPKKIYEELWKTLLDKRVWRGTLKNIDKNKKPFYIDTTVTPILNDKGEIEEFIATRHNITELIEQKEELVHRLYTDSLTGLPNRMQLLEDLKQTSPGSVIALINIDRFSQINEFYGSNIADEALVQMRDHITSFLRGAPLGLYRLYADEFALVLKGQSHKNDAQNLLEALHEHIQSHPFLIQGNAIIINITLGAIHTDTTQYPLTDADMILRHAKRLHKNILILSDVNALKEEIAHNIEYIKKIKEAIAADRIAPYFQKIVDNQTTDVIRAEPYYHSIIDNRSGTISKYECLMRLITPEGKVISPFSFLSVAKKARLYTRLTRIIIEKTFAVFENREDEFSINLSVDDIQDAATVEFILGKMENPELSRRVIFEITESEEFENFEEIGHFIKKIKQKGGRIAIDDFGSGYSNFAYLMNLQADFIKIDASLIKNIDKDPNSRVIVETIVAFAKVLGVKTIAEFVHSQAVFEIVKKIGVDFSQGFFFYEPQSQPLQEKEVK